MGEAALWGLAGGSSLLLDGASGNTTGLIQAFAGGAMLTMSPSC
jgi:hypothetical protein